MGTKHLPLNLASSNFLCTTRMLSCTFFNWGDDAPLRNFFKICGCYSVMFFEYGHLNLIGLWSSEESKDKHLKNTCLKKLDYVFQKIIKNNLNSKVNTIWRTYVFSYTINKHALSRLVTQSRKTQFHSSFLMVFHHRFGKYNTNPKTRIQSIEDGEQGN